MSYCKSFLFSLVFPLIIATPELSLYYTDWVSENNYALQHNCLRIAAYFGETLDEYQIVSYCMGEMPSNFLVKNKNFFSRSTFAELSKQNITSQELYLWSAPIDLIENYQSYLNERSTLLAEKVFYNCTWPRFGPVCEYELFYYQSTNLSLFELIRDFQRIYAFRPITFTCYTHLRCNRGPSPACLDWSEICDGKIDCLDSGLDEEHCWQLEMNECKDNEYRCFNGQCIPKSFYRDHYFIPDCLDGSDEIMQYLRVTSSCYRYEQPFFRCDDRTCKHTHFTSSCVKDREIPLINSMYLHRNTVVSDDCWSAFVCLVNVTDSTLSPAKNCKEIVQNICPDMFYFPSVPGLLGDIYFAYKKHDLQDLTTFPPASFYICYNKSHYDDYFTNVSKLIINRTTCIHSTEFYPQGDPFFPEWEYKYEDNIYLLLRDLKRYHLRYNYTSTICNRSTMYQCNNSPKCISIHRLIDTSYDCPQMDDESMNVITNMGLTEQLKKFRFRCPSSNKYIHPASISNLVCDCEANNFKGCEDERSEMNSHRTDISFQNICDGFVDLLPVMIEGRNETDETECEQWPCINIYTHCNDLWNCPYGVDETGCFLSSTVNCPFNHHLCVSSITNQFTCLPLKQANDGRVDCLGATDEPTLCEKIRTNTDHFYYFHCLNLNSSSCVHERNVCDGEINCENGNDEQFCVANRTTYNFCRTRSYHARSDVENFICNYLNPKIRYQKYFAFNGISERFQVPPILLPPVVKLSSQHQPRCHRGLDLRVWLNNHDNLTRNTCLCPPSFYGDRCQYQNQRISLAIKFRSLSDSWQTPFAIIISLIDDSNERIIHSYEQFSFLSMRDCKVKFNIYLLYSTRPKDLSKHYSIHIDIFEKLSLTFRGSVLLPVYFPFLPVHRLAFIVNIPLSNDKFKRCADNRCAHGKCIKYSNNPNSLTFCQCNQGWTGRYCTIPYTCDCSIDSLCIGISTNNRSICVCPVHKFGPRCLLDTVCQTNNNFTCQNGGQCIPSDDYVLFNRKFICICPKGFSGNRCEIADNKLILSFAEDIVPSQSIFIHFIEIINMHNAPVRSTVFKTIPVKQDSVLIHWARPFHLVFIEFYNKKNYYLAVTQNIYNQSTTTIKTIHSSNRCPHISELLNETIVQWHLLRRIKYYHLPCEIYSSSDLQCFYDDVHFCLCYDFGEQQQRLANCLNFDYNMTFNCLGQSGCENGAQCLQDHPECPTRSMCICPPCYFGGRCQFSTNGFGVSLDAILGYHILPHLPLTDQPCIIKMSLALTIIFIVIGLINGILSLITFKNKSVREVGCGLYLLGSSISTLLITIIFGFKFFILISAQMTMISNRSFLSFQCYSVDFLLRVCLSMDQWLNACVALERAMAAVKDISFNKKKSKQAAKFVITILLLIVIGTCIHDPLYRHLIEEENDDDDVDNLRRVWCVVKYEVSLEIYNSAMYILHFCGPFTINLISTIILIKKKSHQQLIVHPQQTYREHLRRQYHQNKHLLTAPILLIILALPRLILSFVSKCMQSANDSWLYLIGYFISFIPPMLTFIVFVSPSKFYRKEFDKSIQQFRKMIQRRLHRT